MNIKDLPTSLLQASQKVVETQKVLESCPSCGAVVGSCFHTEGQVCSEDEVSAMNVPGEDEPEAQLSGTKEEILVNPPYLTFVNRPRR